MRTAACEVWHSSTASLHVCEVKSTCFVAALHAGKQAVLSLNGFYRAITGWLGPATPRKWALATSQQHIRLVEPPRGASRSVDAADQALASHQGVPTAGGGSFVKARPGSGPARTPALRVARVASPRERRDVRAASTNSNVRARAHRGAAHSRALRSSCCLIVFHAVQTCYPDGAALSPRQRVRAAP